MRLKVNTSAKNYKINCRKTITTRAGKQLTEKYKHNNKTIVKTYSFCIIMLHVSTRA
jgi:hypothetical protein